MVNYLTIYCCSVTDCIFTLAPIGFILITMLNRVLSIYCPNNGIDIEREYFIFYVLKLKNFIIKQLTIVD